MTEEIEIIIEQLKDLEARGMVSFYIERAIEQLEEAKQETEQVSKGA